MAEIEQRNVGSQSLMHGNPAQVIPEVEFVQLVQYLMSQRQARAKACRLGSRSGTPCLTSKRIFRSSGRTISVGAIASAAVTGPDSGCAMIP